MKVRIEARALTSLVIPEGRLDHTASGGFQQQLEAAIAGSGSAPTAVIVDCAALDYVSSAGLRVFLQAARAAERARIRFALCALRPAVREVFDLSGFSRILTVHPDRNQALTGTPPPSAPTQRSITVPCAAAQLPVLIEFLQDFWSGAALAPGEVPAFELALEELFMNVVMHGASGGARQVHVSLALTDRGLALTLEDDGPAFDPLTLPPPDVTASLEERPVGGLGVALVKKMMDSVTYGRVGQRNQIRVSKRVSR